ncbi:MAG: dihydrofolate reductase [Micavibrio sp.]|nr:dihydrofolate reductase [Micavibrio sp.]
MSAALAKIGLIAAVADNNIIGNANELPWKIKSEWAYFARMTKGKPLIMGRKTYESVNGPLKDRPNIVITRDKTFQAVEGVAVVHDIQEAITEAQLIAARLGCDEIMVGGGAEIYRQSLPFADRLYLTEIHLKVDGDTAFPAFNKVEWQEVKREFHEKKQGETADYTITVLERKLA